MSQFKRFLLGAVSIDVSTLELSGTTLKRAFITAVPLQTQVSCGRLSEDESRLLLGCIDGTVAMLDRNRGSTRTIKSPFIPTLAVWCNMGAVAAVANERAQIQYYDTALNCVKVQKSSSDEVANTGVLDLSGYFNLQPALSSLTWGSRDLLGVMEHGPLVCVSHAEKSLTFGNLVEQYLAQGKPQKAIAVLLSWEWGDHCFGALQSIVAYLLKLPLNEEIAEHLKEALGSFHSPVVPLSLETHHKYGSQVNTSTF